MAELQDVCNKVMANIDEKNPNWLSEFTRMECNVWMVSIKYAKCTSERLIYGWNWLLHQFFNSIMQQITGMALLTASYNIFCVFFVVRIQLGHISICNQILSECLLKHPIRWHLDYIFTWSPIQDNITANNSRIVENSKIFSCRKDSDCNEGIGQMFLMVLKHRYYLSCNSRLMRGVTMTYAPQTALLHQVSVLLRLQQWMTFLTIRDWEEGNQ